MHDYIMCTWAFSKNSKNPLVWKKIEEAININIFTWKQDQMKNPNVGLAVYAFAINKMGSEKLWSRLEFVIKETLPYLDERNIVLTIYSFCKMEMKDSGLWVLFEKVLIPKFLNYKFTN